MRWYLRPPVHFVAIGLVLFLGQGAIAPEDARPTLVITAGRVAQLRADFLRETGRSASRDDQRVLVERAIEDELLYHEAQARGLDGHDPAIRFWLTEKMRFVSAAEPADGRTIDEALYRQAVELGFDQHDTVVRRIIIQKMRLLLAREADLEVVTEADVRDYYGRHRERYTQPARISMWHVYLAPQDNGGAEVDALALLDRLRTGPVPPAAAIRSGDPFPLGNHLRAQSAHDLRKLLGDGFARRALALEPGSWHGPVRSSRGLHLVWIENHQPERAATFEAVRSRVRAEYVAERRQAHLVEALASLRATYRIRVDREEGDWEG